MRSSRHGTPLNVHTFKDRNTGLFKIPVNEEAFEDYKSRNQIKGEYTYKKGFFYTRSISSARVILMYFGTDEAIRKAQNKNRPGLQQRKM